MRIGWDQFNAFRFDRAIHERIDALVECGDESKSEFQHFLDSAKGQSVKG
jgi:hypothetical protein